MRHTELAQVLRAANPWWSRRARSAWVADDPLLGARDRHEWVPASRSARQALAAIGAPVQPGSAVVLVGPRAVGKSTAARDALLRVLSDPDVDPRAVLWLPVEAGPDDPFPGRPPLDAEDLDNALSRPTRVGAPACDGPRLLVVDEVAQVPGWADAVARGGNLAQVLVTTSLDDDEVHRVVERHPGWVSVQHLRPARLADLLLADPATDAQVTRAAYLEHGGYPRAIGEHRDLGAVGAEFAELVEDGLARDLCDGTEPCRPDDLLSAICRTATRFLEPGAVAGELGLPAERVDTLLRRLAEAGVLDPRRGLVDPLLHRLPSLRDPAVPPPTAEHVAAFSR